MQKEQLRKKLKIVNQSRESNIQPLGITQKVEKTNEKKAKNCTRKFSRIRGAQIFKLKEGIDAMNNK